MVGNIPIRPKNPNGPLRVISIGRLSRPKETQEQTFDSLEAIRKENERMLVQLYPDPKEILYLAEQISGTVAERETIRIVWDLVATGEWDLIIAEDLSRIFRNPRYQYAFVQDAVDAGIRVICFADNLDTADENWETQLACASVRHGLTVPDTRRRIRRKATDTFSKGGQVGKVRVPYLRVSREDALSGKFGPVGLRIRRNPAFDAVLAGIRLRMEQGHNRLSIVDWLNQAGMPLGAYVTKGCWTLKLFRETLSDPLLHGTRRFRVWRHIHVFKTGKYRRERNPKPQTEYVASLAYMTREEQEQMLAIFDWKINWDAPPTSSTPHSRKGIPRKRSKWPGQAVECRICGGKMFQCGKFLRCSNSFRVSGETCWNHVHVPTEPLKRYVVQWLVQQASASQPFRDTLLTAIQLQLRSRQASRLARSTRLHAERDVLEKKETNLRKAISVASDLTGDCLEALVKDLAEVSAQLTIKRQELSQVHNAPAEEDYTDEQILAELPRVLVKLIDSSFEMAEVLKQLIVRCEVVPVQALDSGLVRARAKFVFRTLSACPDGTVVENEVEGVVDLFEPAAHIRCLGAAVALRSQTPRPTLKQIAAQLGTSYMTVKRALAYQTLMDAEGLTNPYRVLTSKPGKASRWKSAS